MAGTPTNLRATAIAQNPGNLWGKLAIPGAAARITIFSDNTPDATANPNAFHYGGTKAGSKLSIKSSLIKFSIDEQRAPIVSNIDSVQMSIAAELVAATDMDVITLLLPGVATYATTASTFKENRIGITTITYQSVALIFSLIEDTTKIGVFNIYSALNDPGVEFTVARKELGFMPVSFMGFDIPSRVATDTQGNYWKTIA